MTYKCPGCDKEVDRGATVCGNPECRKDLAFCSHCRDVSTYTLVEKVEGRFGRDKYRCARCEKIGMKCLTWAAGGYCNGLARATDRGGRLLCAACHERVGETGRSVIGWTLIGALGGLIRKK
jgi:hypothetical protein